MQTFDVSCSEYRRDQCIMYDVIISRINKEHQDQDVRVLNLDWVFLSKGQNIVKQRHYLTANLKICRKNIFCSIPSLNWKMNNWVTGFYFMWKAGHYVHQNCGCKLLSCKACSVFVLAFVIANLHLYLHLFFTFV